MVLMVAIEAIGSIELNFLLNISTPDTVENKRLEYTIH